MNRLVVTDTGPLLHLADAGVLSILKLTGEILVPQTVVDELEHGNESNILTKVEHTVHDVEYDSETAYPHLDPGETAALILCVGRDAVLLTDDLDARNTATDEDIEVHGSVGVVLYAYSRGELTDSEAKQILRTLKQDTNLYLSTPLLEYALQQVEVDDAGW
ncbi:DUF3368 domain-containing protein [Natrinema gelatinilyticum]|uniref:DUF3368 domain-containing protein n=1 Tax=Natrinema gelatinilyticum TaxID=2961571 RepID=UPI0020C5ADD7|nr:DUF3368 domain-containing protein [Natrinema gelatinilyticum]